MKIIRSCHQIQSLCIALKKKGKSIGFVPTMGFLHEGHLSLFRKARQENDILIVSIFVNPTQFGPREDFRKYPRDLNRDKTLCSREKVDILFVPSSVAVYPSGYQTFVDPGLLGAPLCGKSRPGHFRGVATVVTKLFDLVRPTVAYFGQKDYQQALIIQQLVRDLNMPVKVKILPTRHDRDGLAMSSRNTYLDDEARRKALSIPKTLKWSCDQIRKGVRNIPFLKQGMRKILSRELSRIDYIEIVEARNLSPAKKLSGKILIALAGVVWTVKKGKKMKVRLIDNCLLDIAN